MNTITLSTKISTLSYFNNMMQDGLVLSLMEHPYYNLSFFSSVGLQKPFISFMEVASSLENALRNNWSELNASRSGAISGGLRSVSELMVELDQVTDTLMECVISKLYVIKTISG